MRESPSLFLRLADKKPKAQGKADTAIISCGRGHDAVYALFCARQRFAPQHIHVRITRTEIDASVAVAAHINRNVPLARANELPDALSLVVLSFVREGPWLAPALLHQFDIFCRAYIALRLIAVVALAMHVFIRRSGHQIDG